MQQTVYKGPHVYARVNIRTHGKSRCSIFVEIDLVVPSLCFVKVG